MLAAPFDYSWDRQQAEIARQDRLRREHEQRVNNQLALQQEALSRWVGRDRWMDANLQAYVALLAKLGL